MKTSLLFVCFIISSIAVFSQNTPFKKDLYDKKSIKTTYVTKAMMEMAPDMKIGKVQLRELKNKIDQVEVYSNTGKASPVIYSGWAMNESALKVVRNESYELLLELNEAGKEISFWAKQDNEAIKDLVIINYLQSSGATGRCEVIRLVGKFTIDDIKKISGN